LASPLVVNKRLKVLVKIRESVESRNVVYFFMSLVLHCKTLYVIVCEVKCRFYRNCGVFNKYTVIKLHGYEDKFCPKLGIEKLQKKSQNLKNENDNKNNNDDDNYNNNNNNNNNNSNNNNSSIRNSITTTTNNNKNKNDDDDDDDDNSSNNNKESTTKTSTTSVIITASSAAVNEKRTNLVSIFWQI
jgi:hypothetical protein